ncbi:peroxidase family protein [Streptomyces puniciscabiei]
MPRYNEFRRQLHLLPAEDFDSLTDNPVWAEEMRRVYGGDIERVDLSVGMFAEPRPKGFAFSDTAFRVFVLMASRRLNSDRFLTTDYTPQVYTQTGLDWIENNTMTSVLLRHFPGLRASLRSVDNAFAPWSAAGAPR